jgi:hypothetical protein
MTARLQIPRALAAHSACAARPPWASIFAKAFGKLAWERAELRRMYVSFPWPGLVEVNAPAAFIIVERAHEGEMMVSAARVRDPATVPLTAIGERLQQAKTAPEDVMYRRILGFARLPWPLRRLVLWLSLMTALPLHRYAGSFVVSALGGQGAQILDTISILPIFLSFGPIGRDGQVEVTLCFDHRVMDGAACAATLRGLEVIIEGPMSDELEALQR